MKLYVLALLIFTTSSGSSNAYLGSGNQHCDLRTIDWIKKDKINDWMLGFLTAVDAGPYTPGKGKTKSDIHLEMIELLGSYVDAYCIHHPGDRIADALIRFKEDYMRGNGLCACDPNSLPPDANDPAMGPSDE